MRNTTMMNREDSVSILNSLIETSIDGEKGFLKSAEVVDDQMLKTFFLRRAQQVKESVEELQNIVSDLGGKPAESDSIGGFLHRRWIDLISAITGNNSLAVLDEVERGEDVALTAYKNAAGKDLPPVARLAVMRQLAGAQHNHDQVKQLRNYADI